MAVWTQPVDPDGFDLRHLFVGTHISRMGFDDHTGGWFTIELWVAASPETASPPISRPATYYDFLSPVDKQLLLALVNQARADIPARPKLQAEMTTDTLVYYTAGHVAAYAPALRDMLPHVITVFAETRNFPPPPKVLEAL